MQFTIVFAAILACAYARVYMPPYDADEYPQHHNNRVARDVKDLDWERKYGRGTVFGTLGSTGESLFGRGGYKQDIFNDHRGRLQGQAYGSRVLGSYGDSSSLAGKLDWSNNNAKVAAEVHRQIGGPSGITVTGAGKWKVDKDTSLIAGGTLNKNFGHDRPEFGLEAKIEKNF